MFMRSPATRPPDVVTSYERGMQKVELGQQTGQAAVAALQADIDTYKSKQK